MSIWVWDVAAPVVVAVALAVGGYAIRWFRQARRRERERDVKLDRLVLVFLEGTPPDPFTGSPAVPSVVSQLGEITSLRTDMARLDRSVGELRESNVHAGAASQRLAADVAELREHLAEVRALMAASHPPHGGVM